MWYKRAATGLIVVAALGFSVYALFVLFGANSVDSRYDPGRTISLDEGNAPEAGGGRNRGKDDPIRVAVAPVISPEKSLGLYRPFVERLGAALGKKAILVQRGSYADVNNMVRHGSVDVAFVCTYPFVQGERDFGLKLLAVPVIKGKVTYQSYIIVPSESKAESLLDLEGKRFGSGDILSNSGWLFPATWLMKKGKDPLKFFGEHVITGSHDRSVLAVSSAFVDGGAVDSLVYEQMAREEPKLLERTRVILKSPEFGMPPLVASPDMDADLRRRILEALVHMHETEAGVLRNLGIDRFAVPDDKLYDSVREASVLWESRR